jgi:hypothetical protein
MVIPVVQLYTTSGSAAPQAASKKSIRVQRTLVCAALRTEYRSVGAANCTPLTPFIDRFSHGECD